MLPLNTSQLYDNVAGHVTSLSHIILLQHEVDQLLEVNLNRSSGRRSCRHLTPLNTLDYYFTNKKIIKNIWFISWEHSTSAHRDVFQEEEFIFAPSLLYQKKVRLSGPKLCVWQCPQNIRHIARKSQPTVDLVNHTWPRDVTLSNQYLFD